MSRKEILSPHQKAQLAKMQELMRNRIRLRHMSYSTEQSYCSCLARYALYLAIHKCTGDASSKVEAYLTWMALNDYSATAQNQAFCALLFFYRDCLGQELKNVDALRAKKPKHIPYSPSFNEVQRLLADIQDSGGYPLRLMVNLLYGCGLRLKEVCELRMKDVDLVNSRLTIHQAKGAKDRLVPLPCNLSVPLGIQMAAAAAAADRDRANGLPIHLPGRLAAKYPRMTFSKDWAFVFPARNPCTFKRNGITGRYCCLGENIQRAVRASVRRLGLNDMLHPHSLRHGFSTHAIDQGTNIRDLQEVLGHNSLETTQTYVHAEIGRVRSPIERMDLAVAR